MEPLIDNSNKDFSVVFLSEKHINWLKQQLKNKLKSICYGNLKPEIEPDEYTYHKACKHISDQLATETETRKYGIVAEIIMHLLAPRMVTFNVSPLSMVLSLQDRNIKHGFDINFYDTKKNRIWYGEVKSGYSQERDILITRARDGLREYFDNIDSTEENTEYRWEAAKNEAVHMLYGSKNLSAILKLYTTDRNNIKNKTNHKRNAILMTVNFGKIHHPEFHEDIKKHLKNIKAKKYFDNCILLSVSKEQFEDVIDYLKREGEA